MPQEFRRRLSKGTQEDAFTGLEIDAGWLAAAVATLQLGEDFRHGLGVQAVGGQARGQAHALEKACGSADGGADALLRGAAVQAPDLPGVAQQLARVLVGVLGKQGRQQHGQLCPWSRW